jgi:hypothetical protein
MTRRPNAGAPSRSGDWGRSRNHIISEALQRYLEQEAWQLEELRAGLAAADGFILKLCRA